MGSLEEKVAVIMAASTPDRMSVSNMLIRPTTQVM